jgi:hypothetical protein
MLEMQLRRVDPPGLVEPLELALVMGVRLLSQRGCGGQANASSEHNTTADWHGASSQFTYHLNRQTKSLDAMQASLAELRRAEPSRPPKSRRRA